MFGCCTTVGKVVCAFAVLQYVGQVSGFNVFLFFVCSFCLLFFCLLSFVCLFVGYVLFGIFWSQNFKTKLIKTAI